MENKDQKNKVSIIIPAAGKGSRMNSNIFKALHKIAGQSMLGLVIEAAKQIEPIEIIVVFNEQMRNLEPYFAPYYPNKVKFAYQIEQKGTANAVASALPLLSDEAESVIVAYADAPLIEKENFEDLIDEMSHGADVVVTGFATEHPGEYGRLVIEDEQLVKIVEAKDATEEELEIPFCNSGIMAISRKGLELLPEIKEQNESQEQYLTDLVELALRKNLKVDFAFATEEEVMSVNDKFQLSFAEQEMQNRLKARLVENGAIMPNPDLVTVSFGVSAEKDAIIHPNVVLGPGTEIKNGAEILPFSFLENCYIEPGAVIGPFARIRDRSVVGAFAEIGNFVEVKASLIGRHSKAKHLSYLGNVQIGEKSNIGAGVITCNYNGFEKFKTEIGNEVFIGSNCSLIAPVTISNGSMIAAGSVINENVGENDLAVARAEQKNLTGKAKMFRAKYEVKN